MVAAANSEAMVEIDLDVPGKTVIDSDRTVVMGLNVIAATDSAMVMMRGSG